MSELRDQIWPRIARDGTFAVLLSYLIWFMVNTVSHQLSGIQENGQETIKVLNEIKYAIRAPTNITLNK